MSTGRTYGESCAAAHALDLVGERWALLVVRELLLGPKRFTDLRAGIVHASPNVLAQRLRELEQAGIVRRRTLPPPAASRVYELTEWGLELEPAVIALGRWGSRSPCLATDAGMSLDSHVLAMRAMFDPALAGDLTACLELRLSDLPFRVQVADGAFEIVRGSAEQPDAVVRTEPATLASLIFHGRDLADALEAGEIEVDGDERLVARFLRLFPMPEPAPAPPEGGGFVTGRA
jgi:DNA-binding HxlR family transcriptional regulator